MPLRILLRYLANNEALIQKLSESYPMRRAAQLTAYIYHRGKVIGEEAVDKIKESEMQDRVKSETKRIGDRASSFQRRLSNELQDGFKQLNEEIERQKRKR